MRTAFIILALIILAGCTPPEKVVEKATPTIEPSSIQSAETGQAQANEPPEQPSPEDEELYKDSLDEGFDDVEQAY